MLKLRHCNILKNLGGAATCVFVVIYICLLMYIYIANKYQIYLLAYVLIANTKTETVRT